MKEQQPSGLTPHMLLNRWCGSDCAHHSWGEQHARVGARSAAVQHAHDAGDGGVRGVGLPGRVGEYAGARGFRGDGAAARGGGAGDGARAAALRRASAAPAPGRRAAAERPGRHDAWQRRWHPTLQQPLVAAAGGLCPVLQHLAAARLVPAAEDITGQPSADAALFGLQRRHDNLFISLWQSRGWSRAAERRV